MNAIGHFLLSHRQLDQNLICCCCGVGIANKQIISRLRSESVHSVNKQPGMDRKKFLFFAEAIHRGHRFKFGASVT